MWVSDDEARDKKKDSLNDTVQLGLGHFLFYFFWSDLLFRVWLRFAFIFL